MTIAIAKAQSGVMSINQSESNAGENTDGNLSAAQLIAGLAQTHESPEPEETEQEEPQTEEVEEVEESAPETETEETPEETEEPGEEEPEEEDSLIEQLLAGDPERLKEIARKAGSRGLSRFGELTAKVKALESQLEAKAEAKPLQKPIPNNPFAALKTRAEVEAKIDELEKVAEETDKALDDAEDYGPDDVITFGGKDFTKREIRTANRNSKNALLKLLPAQLNEIARSEQLAQAREHFKSLIPTEIPELADEKSPLSVIYQQSKDDPVYQELLATSAGFQIDYLLAHALRSIHSMPQKKKLAPTVPGEKPKPKVAGNPVGTASRPISQNGKGREQFEKFAETGSSEDLVALLAKQ